MTTVMESKGSEVKLRVGDYCAIGGWIGTFVPLSGNPDKLFIRGLVAPHTARPCPSDDEDLFVVRRERVWEFRMNFADLLGSDPASVSDALILLDWRLGVANAAFIELTPIRCGAFHRLACSMGWRGETNDIVYFAIFGRHRL